MSTADWIAEVLDEEAVERTRRKACPDFSRPMKATLVHEPFAAAGWVYERKLDGMRLIASRRGERVSLWSRNRKRQNRVFPELADAIGAALAHDAVVDGEIVAFHGAVTSFQKLQGRFQREREDGDGGPRVWLYLFDCLHVGDRDCTGLALRERKRLLRELVRWRDPIRWTPHRSSEPMAWLREVCGKGWEGLIAKDGSSVYRHSRSRDWCKFKCGNRQELLVVGYTEPEGEREHFGSLLLAYWDDDELVYAGRVGTGFDAELLADLHRRMRRHERGESPLDRGKAPERGVTWVEPRLVVEVGFTEWTRAGRLRHPRCLGLRTDKDPDEVVREEPS